MNKIRYNGSRNLISDAVEDANFILSLDEFYSKISKKNSFDFSNASGAIVSELIKNSNIIASLDFYKPFPIPPWSRANAYTTKEAPSTIFLNKRKLRRRSIESIAATIIHEYIHLVDFEQNEYHFGHGSNNNQGKSNTVPYWIDQLAYEILTGKKAKLVFHHDESK